MRGRWFLLGAFALLALLSAPGDARADLALPDGLLGGHRRQAARGPDGARLRAGRADVHRREGRPRARGDAPAGSLAATPVIDISDHVATAGDRGLLGIAVDAAFATNHYVYLLYTYDEDPAHPAAEKTVAADAHRGRPGQHGREPADARRRSCSGRPGTRRARRRRTTSDCIPSDQRLALDRHRARRSRRDAVGRVGRRRAVRLHGPRTPCGRSTSARCPARSSTSTATAAACRAIRFCPAETDLTLVCTKLYAKGFRNPFRFQLRPGADPGRRRRRLGRSARSSTSSSRAAATAGPATRAPTRRRDYEELARVPGAVRDATRPRRPRRRTTTSAPTGRRRDRGRPAVHGDPLPGGVARTPGSSATTPRAGSRPTTSSAASRPTCARSPARASRGVDLETTPEGDLVYVNFGDGSANSGSVRRIVFGNAPPPAVAHATPTSGASPLTVQLSADVSVDPDGDAVTYAWDFDGDGTHRRRHADRHRTSTRRPASTPPRLTVRDARGAESRDTVAIAVDEAPPVAKHRRARGRLALPPRDAGARCAARPTTPSTATLSGGALRWRIVLHHGHHIHLVASDLPGAEQSFTPGRRPRRRLLLRDRVHRDRLRRASRTPRRS